MFFEMLSGYVALDVIRGDIAGDVPEVAHAMYSGHAGNILRSSVMFPLTL